MANSFKKPETHNDKPPHTENGGNNPSKGKSFIHQFKKKEPAISSDHSKHTPPKKDHPKGEEKVANTPPPLTNPPAQTQHLPGDPLYQPAPPIVPGPVPMSLPIPTISEK